MSNDEEQIKRLKASFPNAVTATDEEILAFGAKFVHDYRLRMIRELDDFKTATELGASLAGAPDIPEGYKLAIQLRAGLIDTLERLSNIMKGKSDASENQSGIIRPAKD